MTLNLYVNKSYKEFVDQITVVAQANGQRVSTEICKAVKQYMNNLNDEKQMVADKDDWDKFFEKATKEQLLEMSTVICGINDRIIRKICQ